MTICTVTGSQVARGDLIISEFAAVNGGELVATMDQGGPGVADLERGSDGLPRIGKVFTSDDHGRSWQARAETPL